MFLSSKSKNETADSSADITGASTASGSDVAAVVINSIVKVHGALGPGLLDDAYEACLAYELRKRGLKVERQKAMPIAYDGLVIDEGYRVGLMVEGELIVELRTYEKMPAIYRAQVMTFLKLANLKTGFLVNFNTRFIKDGITRISL